MATFSFSVAIAPDGRTLVTSAGIRESTIWLHDARGDRAISGEGFASVPGLGFGSTIAHSAFSTDGTKFFIFSKSGDPGPISRETLDDRGCFRSSAACSPGSFDD